MKASQRSNVSLRPASTHWSRARLVTLVLVAAAFGAACGSEEATPSGSDPGPPTPSTPSTPGAPSTPSAPSTDPTAPPIESTSPGPDDAAGDSTGGVTTSIVVDAGDLGPTARRLVDVAVVDLVERFGLADSPSPVAVIAVEEVTWRDSSIGCPMKGMQYTQVLTPGTRIVLEHEGRSYSYHAGGGRDPFYCAMPESPVADG